MRSTQKHKNRRFLENNFEEKGNFKKIIEQLRNAIPNKNNFKARKKEYINYSGQIKKISGLSGLFSLLKEMLEIDLYPDDVIFNQLIDKLGKIEGAENYISDLYHITVKQRIVNAVTYNSTVKAAGKNGNLELAKEAFDTACEEGLANEKTYASMIDAAGKNGRIDLAEIAYNNAMKARMANVITHTSMINAAGNCSRIDLAEIAYNNAMKDRMANVITHNSMINAAGNCGQIDLAQKIYQNVLDAGMANVITHNSMINAAGNCGQIKLAESAYNKALAANIADVYTYTIMINAAGKVSRFDLAKETFDVACCKKGFANEITYGSMIDVAGKCDQIGLAVEIYNTACKNYLANTIVHTNMMDAFVLNNQLDEAKAIYVREKMELPIKKEDGAYKIDFHEASYGETYVGLHLFIEKHAAENPNIKIIYGKGLHSKTNEDIHPVKKAVQKVISDKGLALFFKEDELNSGLGFINFQNKKELTHFSPKLFPRAKGTMPVSPKPSPKPLNPKAEVFTLGNKAPSTLDPNAPVFVPGTKL